MLLKNETGPVYVNSVSAVLGCEGHEKARNGTPGCCDRGGAFLCEGHKKARNGKTAGRGTGRFRKRLEGGVKKLCSG